MPTINGSTYPVLNIHASPNSTFRIILLDTDEAYLYALMEKLEVLKHYLSDIGCDAEIEVRTTKTASLVKNSSKYGYSTFDDLGSDIGNIFGYAEPNNIDLIYSKNEKLIIDLYGSGKPFQYAVNTSQLENEIGAFLVGKNVAWDLDRPLWNATWFSKYVDYMPLMQNLRKLNEQATGVLGYTPAQSSYVRALQHKAMQVRYVEEIILSYIQKKHYAFRNYLEKDSFGYEDYYDYSFELNYHLGNLYFLLSGTFDIVGRLLADIYDISVRDVRPNIEHSKFQERLKSKNEKLFDLYSEESMNSWIVWIKRKRNYVAHESETSYSDVLKDKKTKLSDDEVTQKVDSMQKWDAIAMLVGDEYVNEQKLLAKYVVRLNEDHEIITSDAMQIKYYDSEKAKMAESLFHPLVDTKADYDMYEKLIDSTAIILLESKPKK